MLRLRGHRQPIYRPLDVEELIFRSNQLFQLRQLLALNGKTRNARTCASCNDLTLICDEAWPSCYWCESSGVDCVWPESLSDLDLDSSSNNNILSVAAATGVTTHLDLYAPGEQYPSVSDMSSTRACIQDDVLQSVQELPVAEGPSFLGFISTFSELEGAVPPYGVQHRELTDNMLYCPSEINLYPLENVDVEGDSPFGSGSSYEVADSWAGIGPQMADFMSTLTDSELCLLNSF